MGQHYAPLPGTGNGSGEPYDDTEIKARATAIEGTVGKIQAFASSETTPEPAGVRRSITGLSLPEGYEDLYTVPVTELGLVYGEELTVNGYTVYVINGSETVGSLSIALQDINSAGYFPELFLVFNGFPEGDTYTLELGAAILEDETLDLDISGALAVRFGLPAHTEPGFTVDYIASSAAVKHDDTDVASALYGVADGVAKVTADVISTKVKLPYAGTVRSPSISPTATGEITISGTTIPLIGGDEQSIVQQISAVLPLPLFVNINGGYLTLESLDENITEADVDAGSLIGPMIGWYRKPTYALRDDIKALQAAVTVTRQTVDLLLNATILIKDPPVPGNILFNGNGFLISPSDTRADVIANLSTFFADNPYLNVFGVSDEGQGNVRINGNGLGRPIILTVDAPTEVLAGIGIDRVTTMQKQFDELLERHRKLESYFEEVLYRIDQLEDQATVP